MLVFRLCCAEATYRSDTSQACCHHPDHDDDLGDDHDDDLDDDHDDDHDDDLDDNHDDDHDYDLDDNHDDNHDDDHDDDDYRGPGCGGDGHTVPDLVNGTSFFVRRQNSGPVDKYSIIISVSHHCEFI